MSASLSPEQGRALVTAARAYIDTPFVHQGRLRGAGVDCGGLVVCAGRDIGLPFEDVPIYSREPWPSKMLRHLERIGTQIAGLEQARPGTLLLQWIVRPRLPQHLTIWTGDNSIVHAWAEANKVCESSFDPYWRDRIHSCWDLNVP